MNPEGFSRLAGGANHRMRSIASFSPSGATERGASHLFSVTPRRSVWERTRLACSLRRLAAMFRTGEKSAMARVPSPAREARAFPDSIATRNNMHVPGARDFGSENDVIVQTEMSGWHIMQFSCAPAGAWSLLYHRWLAPP